MKEDDESRMAVEYMCRHQNYKNPCPQTFKTVAEADEHYFKIHAFWCKECKLGILDIYEQEKHMKEIHNKVKRTQCKICKEIITGFDEFVIHQEANHKGMGMSPPPNSKLPMSLSVETIERLLKDSKQSLNDILNGTKRALSNIIPTKDYKEREKTISLLAELEKASRELDDIEGLSKTVEKCNEEIIAYMDYYNKEKAKR